MNEYKNGDFVDVHFTDGCLIGRVIKVYTDTVTVLFDNAIVEDIPKKIITLWMHV